MLSFQRLQMETNMPPTTFRKDEIRLPAKPAGSPARPTPGTWLALTLCKLNKTRTCYPHFTRWTKTLRNGAHSSPNSLIPSFRTSCCAGAGDIALEVGELGEGVIAPGFEVGAPVFFCCRFLSYTCHVNQHNEARQLRDKDRII